MSDLISRQMALNALKREQSYFSPEDGPLVYYEYRHAINSIKNLPSIEPARMKGELLNASPVGECSVCGYLIDYRDGFNFCPNCGVDLRGSDD